MDKVIKMKDYRRNISVESDTDMSGDECTETFQDLLYLAEKEDRLMKGIFECAHVLEMCPEIVEICILPCGKSQNISTHIQHKLIQAYCWENDIQIVELDNAEFSKLNKGQRHKSGDPIDVECVIVTSKPFIEDIEADDLENEMNENFG